VRVDGFETLAVNAFGVMRLCLPPAAWSGVACCEIKAGAGGIGLHQIFSGGLLLSRPGPALHPRGSTNTVDVFQAVSVVYDNEFCCALTVLRIRCKST